MASKLGKFNYLGVVAVGTDKLHVLQVVDWKKYDLEEWLRQFGYWLNQPIAGDIKPVQNVLVCAMNSAAYAVDVPRLATGMCAKALANYMIDGEPVRTRRERTLCQISDIEAKAVERLVLDIKGTSSILDGWMDAVIDRYFRGCSWPTMARGGYSAMDARFDVKCGLAALHARYPFIDYVTKNSCKDDKRVL